MLKRSECPLSGSLDIFGDKWSLLIIRDIVFHRKSTYGDFLDSDEGISTNILASRLQSLEKNGIIKKWKHPDSKVKILYKLTEKGIDLLPVLLEVYIWAEKYLDMPHALRLRILETKKDKNYSVEKLKSELLK